MDIEDNNKDNIEETILNKPDIIESDATEESATSISAEYIEENEGLDDDTALAVTENTNTHLRRLISSNYLEYASYVIKERAIPHVNDGMKPVQRRILWSMYKMDDGKFNKVANIVGHTMQYHPHGDASIYMALVHLANKEHFIERQGNFGNILTGDSPAAARYIEARLTPLAREVLFNPDITDFIASYDGRNKEPLFFPAKVPALLMSGQEGIAPGMTTSILSHNFKELLEAQIAILKNKSFELFPDFLQGGIMNVSEYEDGNGKITLRAKVDIEGRKLIIRELPAMTTTEKLIASIEKAVTKNKLKVTSINDYTAENVEIEIVPARGYKPEKTLKLLYAYTDCSMSISPSLLVIRENRPAIMTVSDVLKYNTECLVEYLRRELQIELDKLNEKYHEKTLERIFIENRIYKRIEECQTYKLVLDEVRKGLNKFKNLLKREVTDKDIERLLAIPIRRISRFDMNRNKKDIDDILKAIEKTEKNLNSIILYSIKYIKSLIERFAVNFPRRTEIEEFEKVDKRAAALNNIKVGWDRRNCYIGTSIRSDDAVTCNEFDYLHCIEKNGQYKIINIPQKIYIGRLYYFNKYNKNSIFSVIYKNKKKNVYYVKRCIVNKFIRDKEYLIIPKGCQLELITVRERSLYECVLEKTGRKVKESLELDFSKVQMRSPGARGFRFTDRKIIKFRFKGQVEEINLPDEPPVDGNTAVPINESLLNNKAKTPIEKTSSIDISSVDVEQKEQEIVVPVDKKNNDKASEEKIKIVSENNTNTEEPPVSDLKPSNKVSMTEKAEPSPVIQNKKIKKKKTSKKNNEPAEALRKNEVTEKITNSNTEAVEANLDTEKKVKTKQKTEEKQSNSIPKDVQNKSTAAPVENSDSDNDSEWGIVQPDLGF